MTTTTPEPVRPDYPALPLTVQSTYPRLTTAMLSFSMAAVGIVARFGAESSYDLFEVAGYKITTVEVGLAFLGIALICFHIASTCCVLAHAWDAYALGKDRMKHEKIDESETTYNVYKHEVSRQLWIIAVAYAIGFASVLIGGGIIFLKPFPSLSILLFGYVVVSTVWMMRQERVRQLQAG